VRDLASFSLAFSLDGLEMCKRHTNIFSLMYFDVTRFTERHLFPVNSRHQFTKGVEFNINRFQVFEVVQLHILEGGTVCTTLAKGC
jgi:hypothetical protein